MDGMVIPHETRVENGYERYLSSRIKRCIIFAWIFLTQKVSVVSLLD